VLFCAHATSRQVLRTDVGPCAQPMGNYLGMLIALLSLKRKLRSRLGSSLVSQSCNLM